MRRIGNGTDVNTNSVIQNSKNGSKTYWKQLAFINQVSFCAQSKNEVPQDDF